MALTFRPAQTTHPAGFVTDNWSELAHADLSVYTLMKLLGHESMATSQRYVSAAGSETRSAAAQNPLYKLVRDGLGDSTRACTSQGESLT